MSVATTTNRKVAVVYGRDSLAREAIFTFLRDLDLQPVEWDAALATTGKATPANINVVDALFQDVQAALIVMTPDDQARLRPGLRGANEKAHELELTGQPRQNVLIEAGMAFGRYPDRTILVEIGNLRPASDFAGMNVVRIDGEDVRQIHRLATRLETAGCPINRLGGDWLNIGRFRAVIEQLRREETPDRNPLLAPNARGVTPLAAATKIGIVDIDYRDEDDHVLPPPQLYGLAQHEIVVSAISAYQMFTQHIRAFNDLLAAGRHIYVLLLHVDSPDLPWIIERERHPVNTDIAGTVAIIKAHSLQAHSGFHIRFGRRLPPFTATMIDGDVTATGRTPKDADGLISIQPGVLHGTQHQGLILRMAKRPNPRGFDYFAADLRAQWRQAEDASLP